jgi:hypothetical protein
MQLPSKPTGAPAPPSQPKPKGDVPSSPTPPSATAAINPRPPASDSAESPRPRLSFVQSPLTISSQESLSQKPRAPIRYSIPADLSAPLPAEEPAIPFPSLSKAADVAPPPAVQPKPASAPTTAQVLASTSAPMGLPNQPRPTTPVAPAPPSQPKPKEVISAPPIPSLESDSTAAMQPKPRDPSPPATTSASQPHRIPAPPSHPQPPTLGWAEPDPPKSLLLSSGFPSLSTFGGSSDPDDISSPIRRGPTEKDPTSPLKRIIEPILSGSEDDWEKPPKFYSLSPSMTADDLDMSPSVSERKPPSQRRLSITKRIAPATHTPSPSQVFSAASWVRDPSRDTEDSLSAESLRVPRSRSASHSLPHGSGGGDGGGKWDISVTVKRVAHPADRLKKRIRMRELFQPSSASSSLSAEKVEFLLIKEQLLRELDESQQLPVSLPYLPLDGCSWNDLRRYFKYSERFKQTRGRELTVLFDLQVRREGAFHHRTELSCELSSWPSMVTQQVHPSLSLCLFLSLTHHLHLSITFAQLRAFQGTAQGRSLSESDILNTVNQQVACPLFSTLTSRQLPTVLQEVSRSLLSDFLQSEDYVKVPSASPCPPLTLPGRSIWKTVSRRWKMQTSSCSEKLLSSARSAKRSWTTAMSLISSTRCPPPPSLSSPHLSSRMVTGGSAEPSGGSGSRRRRASSRRATPRKTTW